MSDVIENVLWYAAKWGTLGLFVTVAISLAIIVSEGDKK